MILTSCESHIMRSCDNTAPLQRADVSQSLSERNSSKIQTYPVQTCQMLHGYKVVISKSYYVPF